MSIPKCSCPSFVGLSYEEIIVVTGLRETADKSRNCCEPGGYLCPNLCRALREAYNKEAAKRRLKEQSSEKTEPLAANTPTKTKTYKKRALSL